MFDDQTEEQDDPLNEHHSAASETCLQCILPNYPVSVENADSDYSTGREVFNVAPGEGKHPVSIMTDKLCEELSFPALFPKGRFGYTTERDMKLLKDTKDAYIDYIDQHVQAYLPDKETDPQLYDLVKTYQIHNHSKTCRKYKNFTCRFNFGHLFTDKTIVAELLAENMDEEIKSSILAKRQEILSKVKQKIDDVLNPKNPHMSHMRLKLTF